MRMVVVTGICQNRCEVGDITMTVSFTRPVAVNWTFQCPSCFRALTVLRTTVLQDGQCAPVGSLRDHLGLPADQYDEHLTEALRHA